MKKSFLFLSLIVLVVNIRGFDIAAAIKYVDSSAAQVASANISLTQYGDQLQSLLDNIEKELCGANSYNSSGIATPNYLNIGANGNYTNCNGGFMGVYNVDNNYIKTTLSMIQQGSVDNAATICPTLISNQVTNIENSLQAISNGIIPIINMIGRPSDNTNRTIFGINNLISAELTSINNSIKSDTILSAYGNVINDLSSTALSNFEVPSPCPKCPECVTCTPCTNNCSSSDSACNVNYQGCMLNYNQCEATYNSCTTNKQQCDTIYETCQAQSKTACYNITIAQGHECANYSPACNGTCGAPCQPYCSSEIYLAYLEQVIKLSQDYKVLFEALLAYQPYDTISFSSITYDGDVSVFYPDIYKVLPTVCSQCNDSNGNASSCCTVETVVFGDTVSGVDCSNVNNSNNPACLDSLTGYINYVTTQVQQVADMTTNFNAKGVIAKARLNAIVNQLNIFPSDIKNTNTSINKLAQVCLKDIQEALHSYGIMSEIISTAVQLVIGTLIIEATGGLGVPFLPLVLGAVTMIPAVNEYTIGYISSPVANVITPKSPVQ